SRITQRIWPASRCDPPSRARPSRHSCPPARVVALRSPSRRRTSRFLLGRLPAPCDKLPLRLLLRDAGGDFGFLAIDAAKADIAISPCWSTRKRLVCTITTPGQPATSSAVPPKNEQPNSNVRFKSQPPCSVIHRSLARRAENAGPAPRRTTRWQRRSRRPD